MNNSVLFIDMKSRSKVFLSRKRKIHTHKLVYTYVNSRMIASLTNTKKKQKKTSESLLFACHYFVRNMQEDNGQ